MESKSTRQGNGRRKTKLEKVVNESHRRVTFSKRRKGLFKKAFELSILTKAEIAITIKSASEKVYSFAHPNLEVVAKKFLTGNPLPMSYMEQQIQVQRNEQVTRKITELETIENNLEDEIKHGKDLDLTLEQSRSQYWGASENLSQLKQSAAALKNLKANVKREIEGRLHVGQQNYDAPTGNDLLHTQMILSLVGTTYNGAGSGNSLPTLPRHNLSMNNGHGSSNGRGLPAFPRLNVNEVDEGSGGVVYRGGRNWSTNNGPRSSNGRGLPAFPGRNVYEFGEGSGSSGNVYRGSDGTSLHNVNSSFSRRYSPYTQSLTINEGGHVNSSGGGDFYGGASGSLFNDGSGRGLPSTNGAILSGVANNNVGSIDVPGLDGSVPYHGFGVDFRYGSI